MYVTTSFTRKTFIFKFGLYRTKHLHCLVIHLRKLTEGNSKQEIQIEKNISNLFVSINHSIRYHAGKTINDYHEFICTTNHLLYPEVVEG